MQTRETYLSDTNPAIARKFPAYGPIEAILGYALFYVLVDHTTPAVVETFSETVLDLPPSFVRFGLATALWFILVVTFVDQVRRQLAALGVISYEESHLRVWSRVTPSSLRITGYLAVLLVGSTVAAWTFERALETLLSLIPFVPSASTTGVDIVDIFVTVVFFVAYSGASHSLDRLVIDAIRAL